MTDVAAPSPPTKLRPTASPLRKLATLAAAALVLPCMLTACGQATPCQQASTPYVAFVWGARANQVNANPTDPTLAEQLSTAVKDCATVTVVNAGGAPQVTGTVHLANSGDNPLLQQRQSNKNSASLRHLIASAAASAPEANTLGAIDAAARAVRDGSGSRTIVVVDSGLSTVGLRFQDGILTSNANASSARSWLANSESLPDLHGIRLVWFGLGQTSAPQPPPPISARNRLQRFWQDVITASGGTVRFLAAPVTPDVAHPGLPKVTVISFTDPGRGPLPTLTDRQVGFVQGQTTLREPAVATRVLNRLAELIVSGRYRDVWLTGTASSEGQASGNVRLSAARAHLVAKMLETAGVPGDVLHTRGLGSSFSGFVFDREPDGSVNESLAGLNRLVLVSSTRPAGW